MGYACIGKTWRRATYERKPIMKKATRFVGLDVHADSIAVAVAESGRDGEVRSLGMIPNRVESVRRRP